MRIVHLIILASTVTVAACGGGSSGGDAPVPVPPPTVAPAITFANVSVHDPSIIKASDGSYYIFGSHLAAAKSTDLMNWTLLADGVNATNPLFNNVLNELKDTFAWSTVNDLWAPDVARLPDGKYYFFYDSCIGTGPKSALGVAVADGVIGPFVNKQIVLRSGMTGISDDGTTYDSWVHPNVVDPQVFADAQGKWWMIYGSYSGGIFIIELDAATGLPKTGQGYGKHLLGGNHARIEGAYVVRNAQTGYYYLFSSFGGLDANGGYNIRVARSATADGPYFDAAGVDMATVKGDPNRITIFDDPRYAPYGQKLVGNYQYVAASGETGTQVGYVSPGHNSVYFDSSTNQYFVIFHTRFPGRGEYHEVRVHELFFNQDGWPVMAPFRYVPLSKSPTTLSPDVLAADVPGTYKFVNHGKGITASVVQSQSISLAAGGSLGGSVTGTWSHDGTNRISITIGSDLYRGVLSRQWNPNANAFAVTFTVQSVQGVSLWGVRSGS